jgi:ubiquinone/menaquinone biosynthesis C-methylase UbiE
VTAPHDASPVPEQDARRRWFVEHHGEAADAAIAFLRDAGIELAGKTAADIGCGDGILDLGLAQKSGLAHLTGYDIRPTDTDHLLRVATAFGVADALPDNLAFVESSATRLPASDASFDLVLSWSAFEHIAEPKAALEEIRRVLKPTGAFFLQLWPFYHSDRGSHLWEWFPASFHHLIQDDAAIEVEMRAAGSHPIDRVEYMLSEYHALNRITLDELQAAMLSAGLAVRRVEVMAPLVNVPDELSSLPLSVLTTAGVKLIAGPVEPHDPAAAAAERLQTAARAVLDAVAEPRSLRARAARRLLGADVERQRRAVHELIGAANDAAAGLRAAGRTRREPT